MNSVKQIKKLIEQLSFILSKEHKKQLPYLFVCGVLSAILELLGVTVILPFVQVIMDSEKVMNNKYLSPILNYLEIHSAKGVIVFIGVLIILLYLFKNIYLIAYVYFQNAFAARVQTDLSISMVQSYLKRPYVFYTNTSSAEISRGSEDDTIRIQVVVKTLLEIATQMLYFLAISIYIFVTDPVIASGVVIILLITAGIIFAFFKPIAKDLGKKNLQAMTDRGKILFQITQGIKDIYVTNRRELFVKKYTEACGKTQKTTRDSGFINGIPDRIVEGICVSGLIGVIILRLLMGSDMQEFVPKLAVFAMAAFKLLPSVGGVASRINILVFNMPPVDNVYNNLKEAKIKADYVGQNACADYSLCEQIAFNDKIQIEGIAWKYETANKEVLSNVFMNIKKGEAIGLVGPSGSGKTTLIDIFLGLYKPQKGCVLVDGIDVFSIPNEWSRMVSYVQQNVFLTDDTVRANVAFGLENVTDDKIWDALDRASIGKFIRGLPDGLDTLVGERGVKFSGGQRQRIAIARALYNNPEILVLDEATSALDNETEQAIMESIEALQGHVTMIIVAHRLTTIQSCDRIYKIENGVATEQRKEDIFGDVE